MSGVASYGELVPGEELGPYRVVRRIGGGGMGVVYEALDTTLGRGVALKVISTELAGTADFRARFVREARAQASLDSPHVVQVFAHGELGGRLYLATQLIPDGDLSALLRRSGPLPVAQATDLIAQVAEGLAEAHRVGLVHRDIKPGNVLLRHRGPDTVAYLADFGIAQRPECGESTFPGETVAGTPGYLAPELRAGAAASASSDVYALGCLLWAALTGRPPVAVGASAAQLPRSAPRRRELHRILEATLAEDPAERCGSAAALAAELRSLVGTTSRRARRTTHSSALTLAVALAATTALSALAPVVWERGGAPSSQDPGADSGAAEQTAIAHLARSLTAAADLRAVDARCTARELIDRHGIVALQERGLVARDLRAPRAGLGQLTAPVLSEVLTSALHCLWTATP